MTRWVRIEPQPLPDDGKADGPRRNLAGAHAWFWGRPMLGLIRISDARTPASNKAVASLLSAPSTPSRHAAFSFSLSLRKSSSRSTHSAPAA